MPNPLHPEEQFDLSEMNGNTTLQDKRGPVQVDVLVCPTAPTLPPLLEEVKKQTSVDSYMNDVFTVPASLAGIPAISVPVSIPKHLRSEDNVPFTGIQVIGQYWDDFHVINVGGMICHRRSRPEPRIPAFNGIEAQEQALKDQVDGDSYL